MNAASGGRGRRVRVVRTGGITGMRLEREVDLDRLDQGEAAAWRGLLAAAPAVRAPKTPERARPDGFGYRIISDDDGIDVTVPEQQLPAGGRELLERTLRRG